jgi:membrane-associated phospholipid phosphatase
MSVGFLYIIPIILYYITGNVIHLKGLLGVVGTTIISESIKIIIIGNRSPRPKGAIDCNFLCNDGNQKGRPGMPSSHSAEVVFFSSFYLYQTSNPIIRGILIIYAGLVMLSRYYKKCHTINQIIMGALLGLGLNWFLVRQL